MDNNINFQRCTLCGSKEYKVIRNNLRYGIKRRVLKCRECGLVYQESSGPAKGFYSGKDYRNVYGPSLKKESNSREIFDAYFPFQQDIVSEIRGILKPNTKVLDVGCSTGHFLASIKGLAGERVGLELDQNAVDFIRKNLDFKVYSEPIEKVEIKEGLFDLITALQVIEHTEDPLAFLENIAKNLKPNGYLYLELPNVSDVFLEVYKISGYEDFYYREPHLWYFSRETLKLLLDKAGFKGEIKTVQRYNFLNHLYWIFCDKPQDNFAVGNSVPVLVKTDNTNKNIKKDLNDFIKRVDKEYKQILVKYYLGENLTFLGKKQ